MNVVRSSNGNHASGQVRLVYLTVTGLLAVTLAHHALSQRRTTQVQRDAVASSSQPIASVVRAPSIGVAADNALQVRPDQVLATVNGHRITVMDTVPFAGTNQEMKVSPEALKFYLHRAVERELIFEAAQKQGIVLDDSQNQQVADMQAMRNQREPGGVAKLNDDPAGRRLEVLDAEAFMLQTSIMAAHGTSPNVTESQVQEYFQQHQSEFESVPNNADARGLAWQRMAFQIRSQLAASTRSKYNSELAAYMHQIESEADVVFNSTP